LRNAALLVMSNKKDLPGSLSTAQITDQLNLHAHKGRDWYIQVFINLDNS
jgi:signal recognition particle receptor subunit beta